MPDSLHTHFTVASEAKFDDQYITTGPLNRPMISLARSIEPEESGTI